MASLPGFGRRCLLASVAALLASSLDFLQGTFEKIHLQRLVNQHALQQSDFSYWDSAEQAIHFREALSPTVIRMDFRLAELENPARQHGIRLGQVATRQNTVPELKRASIVMRAESYRRRLFSEFDRAKEMFLP